MVRRTRRHQHPVRRRHRREMETSAGDEWRGSLTDDRGSLVVSGCPMISALENELREIEPVQVNPDKLTLLKSEEDFTAIAVDLLVELGSYVCVAACILPGDTKCWNRDQAIVGGNSRVGNN